MWATSVLAAGMALGDVYMHNPRGSNNRLNERSANRNNGNRMFDSQNNNRGGYNKGDVDDQAAADNFRKQYDMMYYMSDPRGGSSELSIEWTNQHGCGGNEHGDPHKLNCQITIQYMCHPNAVNTASTAANSAFDPDIGPIDGFRPDCTKECLMPVAGNPECLYPSVRGHKITAMMAESTDKTALPVADVTRNACTPTEYMTPASCTRNGGKWVDAQVNDKYNCPQGASYDDNTDRRRMRDGTTTNRQDFTNPANGALNEQARAARKAGDVKVDRGLHESWEWYDECYRRERNRGLFTADQNLRNNALGYSSAVYTRQNPNNNRRGYECPEERDYYPYWHWSPWRDVAVMTDRLDKCQFYQEESQNVKGKYLCRNTMACSNCIRYNNEKDCHEKNGRWVQVGAWSNVRYPESTVKCIQAPWSRVNHLGNGRFGQANTFNWTIPYVSNRNEQCVVRLRYNISTDDYDYDKTNSSFNQNNGQSIQSPVRQNPAVDAGLVRTSLRLAINTAQFGRTFQDRSHVVTLVPRPGQAQTKKSQDFFGNRKLYNLNVRGKRCNIVQCFPSVEYDYMPAQLNVSENDLVHFQWTGSNTHNNGNPAGDGQAGDAGEGRRGTDRHNVAEMKSKRELAFGASFPATWEENTMFKNLLDAYSPEYNVRTYDNSAGMTWDKIVSNWAVRMATANFYLGYDHDGNKYMKNCAHLPRNEQTAAVNVQGVAAAANVEDLNSAQQMMIKQDCADTSESEQLQRLLNNAPASFPGGVFRFSSPPSGKYNYMDTRNNNFSNRDVKGVLLVTK